MLLVPSFVAPSPIHGLGCFTSVPITKGTLVWKLEPRFDLLFSDAEYDALPQSVQSSLDHYVYKVPGMPFWILESDDTRFFNHSRTPNVANGESVFESIAVRDIAAGEELICDYRKYAQEDPQPWM